VQRSGLLVWRNDTPLPIFIAANLSNGVLSVTLWGQSDGRTTTMRGPTVRRGIDVMHTTLTRVVLAPNGTVIHNDTVCSSYKNEEELFVALPELIAAQRPA